MVVPLSNALLSLLVQHTHRLATCWKVVRQDGAVIALTNHDTRLTLIDGIEYKPALQLENEGVGIGDVECLGGVNQSAVEKQEGFDNGSRQLVGVLDSTKITHAMLDGGWFREARVDEYTVDWKYPWAGNLKHSVYWIVGTEFTDQQWTLDVEGVGYWLRTTQGRRATRTCEATLGDDDCGVNVGNYTTPTYTIVSGDLTEPLYNPRTVLKTPSLYRNAYDEGWAQYGKVHWLTGANAGFESEIILDTQSSPYAITFGEPTTFDMALGDTYYIVGGCDRRFVTCKTKFSNGVEFRGCPHLIGRDALLDAPDAK